MKPPIKKTKFGSITVGNEIYPTPAAIEKWNRADGKYFGLFHVTC